MSDDMDAMMADGLLHTVRECARRLYGENQTYPCDDVKRMAAEVERLRAALEPLACTCDRANGDACSRAEADCAFWIARAALEEKT